MQTMHPEPNTPAPPVERPSAEEQALAQQSLDQMRSVAEAARCAGTWPSKD